MNFWLIWLILINLLALQYAIADTAQSHSIILTIVQL